MKAIVNANVVLPNGIIWDGVILINGDRIAEVKSSREIYIPPNVTVINAKGTYVGPGFVDIHVHGGNGYSTSLNPKKAAEFFLKHGTTSFLATPSYVMNFDEFMEAISTVKAAMGSVKTLKGMYMEGPYTNPNYGAHAHKNPWRSAICPKQFKALVDEVGDLVRIWTVAPEREGIMEFLEYAKKVNPDVIFSVGHSEATPMQIRALGKYRPKLLTHMTCATGRQKAFVHGYGPDEYCAKETDMYAELISDSCGIHVHPELQQCILHSKGVGHVILITDSTIHNYPKPPQLSHVTDLNFDANGRIAGSKLTMDKACKNIMTHTNCGIVQAFVMASLNPARVLGMDEEIGSVEVGKKADLVFVDDKFNVTKVMLGGNLCNFDNESKIR